MQLYFNECSYQCLPQTELLKRLTVTVPLNAVLTGAYPLLFLITVLFISRNKNSVTPFWKITFISLLLLALYFPFSISPYVPLCHDMRQFFFLFPLAVIIFTTRLQEIMLNEKHIRTLRISGCYLFTLVTLICVLFAPYNKWAALCNSFLGLIFIFNVFPNKKTQQWVFYLMIPFVLWLSTAYPIYNKLHKGYTALKTIDQKLKQQTNISTNTYYFLNNDTKTHVALIDQFDTAKHFLNLDTVQKGFKPFISYQQQLVFNPPGGFQNGWLIVSDAYLESINAATISSIKQLLEGKYFAITVNKTTAYYLTSAETIERIMHLLNSNNAAGNCY